MLETIIAIVKDKNEHKDKKDKNGFEEPWKRKDKIAKTDLKDKNVNKHVLNDILESTR